MQASAGTVTFFSIGTTTVLSFWPVYSCIWCVRYYSAVVPVHSAHLAIISQILTLTANSYSRRRLQAWKKCCLLYACILGTRPKELRYICIVCDHIWYLYVYSTYARTRSAVFICMHGPKIYYSPRSKLLAILKIL